MGSGGAAPPGLFGVVDPAYHDWAVAAISPCLALDRGVRTVINNLRDYFHLSGKKMRTDDERNATVMTEEEKKLALQYWRDSIKRPDTLADEQFDVLDRLVRDILSSGQQVVLVDLPIPQWHAARSPYFAYYQKRKQSILQAFADKPGFHYLNMQDLNNDPDFSDEVHPKPRHELGLGPTDCRISEADR